jgi:hypothetical protein
MCSGRARNLSCVHSQLLTGCKGQLHERLRRRGPRALRVPALAGLLVAGAAEAVAVAAAVAAAGLLAAAVGPPVLLVAAALAWPAPARDRRRLQLAVELARRLLLRQTASPTLHSRPLGPRLRGPLPHHHRLLPLLPRRRRRLRPLPLRGAGALAHNRVVAATTNSAH